MKKFLLPLAILLGCAIAIAATTPVNMTVKAPGTEPSFQSVQQMSPDVIAVQQRPAQRHLTSLVATPPHLVGALTPTKVMWTGNDVFEPVESPENVPEVGFQPGFVGPTILVDVTESEPNDDCTTADPMNIGDRVFCGQLTASTDTVDYFTFTLDGTNPYWAVVCSTYAPAPGDCTPAINDTKLSMFNSDCSVLMAYQSNKSASDLYSKFYLYNVPPGTYKVKVHGNSNTAGPWGYYHMVVSAGAQPCDLTCPPGSVAEGEPDCYALYVDNTNGGCNSTPNVFGPTPSFGKIICGKAGTYMGAPNALYRDTDWYPFTLTVPTHVIMYGASEFPTQWSIFLMTNPMPNPCPAVGGWQYLGAACEELTGGLDFGVLAAGTYVVFIGPSTSGASYRPYFPQCGSLYWFQLVTDGENCDYPLSIPSIPFSETRSLCGYADDYAGVGPDVVYQLTLAQAETLDFSLCNSPLLPGDEIYDTFIGIWAADSCGTGNTRAFDDDGCMPVGEFGTSKLIAQRLAAGTYYVWVGAYDYQVPCAPYTLEITRSAVCVVTCPPGGDPEGEPACYDNYWDTYNGGCSQNTAFQLISDGDTICGVSGVFRRGPSLDTLARDNDWYQVTVPYMQEIRWGGTAEFPFRMDIWKPGTPSPCGNATIPYGADGVQCETLDVGGIVQAGTWWLRIRPSNFDEGIQCGAADYVVWYRAIPPTLRDATVTSVDAPHAHTTPSDATGNVAVSVTNIGVGTYTFPVRVIITGAVSGPLYNNVVTADNVTQVDTVQLAFPQFTPPCLEQYLMEVRCEGGVNEQNPVNDTAFYYFDSFGYGWRTYVDGSSYWIYPHLPTQPVDGNAVRMVVPPSYTATLDSLRIRLYNFSTSVDSGTLVPTIWTDNNGNPGAVLWAGTPIFVPDLGPGNGGYEVLLIDVSGTGLNPTSDFWIGYLCGPYTPGLNSEGQTAIRNYPMNERAHRTDGAGWVDLTMWANPLDPDISCKYSFVTSFMDGSAQSVDSPVGLLVGGGPYEVKATFANTGKNSISGASASVTITGPGGTDFTATQTGISLGIGASLIVDFGDWIPSSSSCNFTTDIALTVGGDQNLCNNENSAQAYVVITQTTYMQDFEANNGGFTEVVHSGPSNIWQWGTDTQVSPPPSGTKVWGTVLNANYPDLGCASLVTPSILIPANAAMSFMSWYITETDWDYCNLKVSTNGGTSWSLLTPLAGYDSQDLYPGNLCPTVSEQWGWNGVKNYWLPQAFDMAALSGQNVLFSFDFASDGGTNAHGFYLDDFSIVQYVPHMVNWGPASFSNTLPEGSNTTRDTIIVRNTGAVPLNVTFSTGTAWLTVPPGPFVVPGGASLSEIVVVDGTGLPVGTYNGSVTATGDDVAATIIEVPIDLEVVPGGCAYEPGDVNGSGSFDGIDVGMAVNYFRGASLPPGAVRCPPCSTLGLNMLYPEGDVNATCTFNGIDIGYMVNHFKYWGPPDYDYPTLYCLQCPPARAVASSPAETPAVQPILKSKGEVIKGESQQ